MLPDIKDRLTNRSIIDLSQIRDFRIKNNVEKVKTIRAASYSNRSDVKLSIEQEERSPAQITNPKYLSSKETPGRVEFK